MSRFLDLEAKAGLFTGQKSVNQGQKRGRPDEELNMANMTCEQLEKLHNLSKAELDIRKELLNELIQYIRDGNCDEVKRLVGDSNPLLNINGFVKSIHLNHEDLTPLMVAVAGKETTLGETQKECIVKALLSHKCLDINKKTTKDEYSALFFW